jgi:hypothetical protein
MRLVRKDGVATVFVAVATVLSVLNATGAALTGMSPRVLGAVILALGWAACTSNQSEIAAIFGPNSGRRPPIPYIVTASAIGAAALVAGIIALVTASETALLTLVAATVTLWAMSVARHAIASRAGRGDAGATIPLARAA